MSGNQRYSPSHAQERLWFLDRLESSGGPTYTMASAFRIRGEMATETVERAVAALVARHEELRTVFPDEGGRPVAEIRPADRAHASLTVEDLTNLAESDRTAAALGLLRDRMRAPFELATGPLCRFHLLRLGPAEHVLGLAIHHIICDSFSLDLLFGELGTLLSGGTAGSPPRSTYRAYAAWEHSAEARRLFTADLEHWKRRLAGPLTELDLPADRPRPSVPTFTGARHVTHVPDEVWAGMRKLARRHRASDFMVFLTALFAVLSRCSGQDDLLVGMAIANRGDPAFEQTIGLLINTVVLRVSTADDPTVVTLLDRVREAVFDAYEHGATPFDLVVSDVAPHRDLSRTPLVPVMTQMRHEGRRFDVAGLTVDALDIDLETAKFDLVTELVSGEGPARIALEYAVDLFAEPTVAALGGHLVAALRHLAGGDGRISEIPLLSPAERASVLRMSSGGPAGGDEAATVVTMFDRQAALHAGKTAVSGDGRRFGYTRLAEHSREVTATLRYRGVRPGDVVAILLDRGPEMIGAMIGVLRAGAAYLLLDPGHPPKRVTWLVRDSGAVAVVTSDRHAALIEDAGAVLITELRPGGDADDAPVTPRNPAYVVYTSGSTGAPKGVVIAHGGLTNLVTWHQRFYRVTEHDRASHVAGLGFDAATWEVWPYLCGGATIVLAPDGLTTDPPRMAGWLADNEIDTAFLPTPLAQVMLGPDLLPRTGLQKLLTGGDRLLARPAKGLSTKVYNNYGPSESTVCSTAGQVLAADHASPPSIGRPIDGAMVYVLDPSLRPVPVGMRGEIYVGGAGVGLGYLGRGAQTAASFLPDPFSSQPGARMYRTGDVGRYTRDGMIEFSGRNDDQIELNGFRIEPSEVEAALQSCPGVAECAVGLRTAENHARYLVAYLTCRPGHDRARLAETTRAHLRDRLPMFMLPAVFVALDALPMTANGKIDRRALAELTLDRPGEDREMTETERLLARLVSELVGDAPLAARDNFFELGGDSMLALELAVRAREAGVALDLRTIVREQTIQAMARACEEGAVTGTAGRYERCALLSEKDRGNVPASAVDAYPAGMMQSAMLAANALDPDSAAYQHVIGYDVAAPFDTERLRTALRELSRRHPILRTRFDLANFDVPVQVVEPTVDVPVTVVDGGSLDDAWETWTREIHRRPPEPEVAPLLRIGVMRASDRFRIGFGFHHAILDARSLDLLVAELSRLIDAEETGRPAVNWAFRDFVAAEQRALETDGDRRFWRRYLARESCRVFGDDTPPGGDAVSVAVEVPADAARRAAESARENGVAFATLCLAAHGRVIAERYEVPGMFAGFTTHLRPEKRDALTALGLFINTVPIHLRPHGKDFEALLAEVEDAKRAALEHARIPFPALLREAPGAAVETVCSYVRHGAGPAGAAWTKFADLGTSDLPLTVTFIQDVGRARLDISIRARSAYVRPGDLSDLAERYLSLFQRL